jgi:hypothetical protein
MSTNRLNYWRLLAQEHELEVEEATREADIPRAIRATMAMTQALTRAEMIDRMEECGD